MAVQTPQHTLEALANGDRPVLEQLVKMNLDTLDHSGLDPRTYFMARFAALVAIDAAPASYLLNLGIAREAGMTYEDAQGVLIAIAPVVGSARVTAAAGNILRAAAMGQIIKERREEAH